MKDNPDAPLAVRIISILTTLLLSLAAGEVYYGCIIASAVLLFSPKPRENGIVMVAISLLIPVIMAVIAFLVKEVSYLRRFCSIMASGTILILQCFRTGKTLSNSRYLLRKDAPLERIAETSDMVFSMLLMFGCLISWGGVVSSAYSIALFLILLYRAFSGKSLISSRKVELILSRHIYVPERAVETSKPVFDCWKLYDRIVGYMDTTEDYIDCNFCEESLMREMGTNRTYLSEAINTCSGMNFKQLLNRRRVDYSMRFLCSSEDMTVEDIARRSGFKTASSYNIAFKYFYGTTPKAYRTRNLPDPVIELQEPLSSQTEPEPQDRGESSSRDG